MHVYNLSVFNPDIFLQHVEVTLQHALGSSSKLTWVEELWRVHVTNAGAVKCCVWNQLQQ